MKNKPGKFALSVGVSVLVCFGMSAPASASQSNATVNPEYACAFRTGPVSSGPFKGGVWVMNTYSFGSEGIIVHYNGGNGLLQAKHGVKYKYADATTTFSCA